LRLLRTAGGSIASLESDGGNPDLFRIAIARVATTNAYDIQVNLPGLSVKEGRSYVLSFLARADRDRHMSVGLADAEAPWADLGLYESIDLTREWQSWELRVAAARDQDNARILFDVGDCDGSVEVAAVALRCLTEGRFVRPSLAIHQHGYWVTAVPIEEHIFDERFCAECVAFLQEEAASVADFGCGTGLYVAALCAAGIAAKGFDGNPYTEQLTGGLGVVLDLSEDVQLATRFDWILSLEVGEHIPKEYEQAFINNLHRHNRRGVVLSWALEGQVGLGHVNGRDNGYVESQFRRLGYERDVAAEKRLRAAASVCSWFAETVMVFRR
jgi:hypothetical protein